MTFSSRFARLRTSFNAAHRRIAPSGAVADHVHAGARIGDFLLN